MQNPTPPPADDALPAPRHPLGTLACVGLFLAAFAGGLMTLRWQVQTLTALRPHSRKPAAAPAARGTEARTAFRFNPGQLVAPRAVSVANAPSSAGVGSYELTADQVLEVYRNHYLQKGNRDEEYVTLLALNHTDRGWSAALSKAERAMDAADFELARQTLADALAATDPRNLVGRARLFEFMRQLEVRAGNPDRARELGHLFDEARIHTAEIVVRACGNGQGGVTGEEGQQLLAALKTEEDMRDVVNQGGKTVSDQGEDPEKAPERIATTLLNVTRAKADIGKAD